MEQILKFEFSVDETNMILAGLGELPAKHSIDLIMKIKQSAAAQFDNPEKIIYTDMQGGT